MHIVLNVWDPYFQRVSLMSNQLKRRRMTFSRLQGSQLSNQLPDQNP